MFENNKTNIHNLFQIYIKNVKGLNQINRIGTKVITKKLIVRNKTKKFRVNSNTT